MSYLEKNSMYYWCLVEIIVVLD